ncbi:MAG: ABC transporter permease subunit [Armatimonadetes bacterium]|nr:ABC transporter permease subunit [Armatimonadota bacterium]MCX7967494.1 ABC transporter permease subunit [Armatimonadota bacterium]MDW8144311.1 ABC transporter permease subunit [Armatimonadota bacterium]
MTTGKRLNWTEFWFKAVVFAGLFVYLGLVLSLLWMDAILPFRAVEEVPAIVTLWRDPLARRELLHAFKLSVLTATITTVFVVLLGVPTAYALSRYRFRLAIVLDTIVDLLIIIPPLVVGLTIIAIFGQTSLGRWLNDTIGVLYTTQGIVIAQFAVASALGIRVFKAAFDQVNPRFEQVARSLGASPVYAFFRITLPLAKNGLLAGSVLAWARAMGEFAPVLIVAGTDVGKVLPVLAFLNMSGGNIELSFAVTTFMVLVSAAALLTFKRLGGQVYIW